MPKNFTWNVILSAMMLKISHYLTPEEVSSTPSRRWSEGLYRKPFASDIARHIGYIAQIRMEGDGSNGGHRFSHSGGKRSCRYWLMSFHFARTRAV